LLKIVTPRRSRKGGGNKSKGKAKGLDTFYSAIYMSQIRDQQRFTISEVAADWPMAPQRIMWPSIARADRRQTGGSWHKGERNEYVRLKHARYSETIVKQCN